MIRHQKLNLEDLDDCGRSVLDNLAMLTTALDVANAEVMAIQKKCQETHSFLAQLHGLLQMAGKEPTWKKRWKEFDERIIENMDRFLPY